MGLCFSNEIKEHKKARGQTLSNSTVVRPTSTSPPVPPKPQHTKSVDVEEARRLRLEAVEKRMKNSKYRGTQNGGGALLAKLEKQKQKPPHSHDTNHSSNAEGGLSWVIDS
ncbi:hypothetical protein HMI56_006092 [Coelomomyces lativittatus]|nr:hypothetical protein HMI56_006092 [Coelomomyces lativittatus]